MSPLAILALVVLVFGVLLAAGAAGGWLPAAAGHAGTVLVGAAVGLALFASAR